MKGLLKIGAAVSCILGIILLLDSDSSSSGSLNDDIIKGSQDSILGNDKSSFSAGYNAGYDIWK